MLCGIYPGRNAHPFLFRRRDFPNVFRNFIYLHRPLPSDSRCGRRASEGQCRCHLSCPLRQLALISGGKGKTSASEGSNQEDTSDNKTFLPRSEEHTSELQSLAYLVCRLL